MVVFLILCILALSVSLIYFLSREKTEIPFIDTPVQSLKSASTSSEESHSISKPVITKDDFIKKLNLNDPNSLNLNLNVTVTSGTSAQKNNIDTSISGSIIKKGEDLFVINPNAPYPLTLMVKEGDVAFKIKDYLDSESIGEYCTNKAIYLFARHNVRCLELDNEISRIIGAINSVIEKHKENSVEWKESSEKDKLDMETEFRLNALNALEQKPVNEYSLEYLIKAQVRNIEEDDDILSFFENREDLYDFFVRRLEKNNRVQQIPANDYQRKNWETLVELGFALRGQDLGIEEIIEMIRMKDINEMFSDRIDKPFARKAKAYEFALSQPDIKDKLSHILSFRELFKIKIGAKYDVEEIKKCWETVRAQYDLIRDTYVMGYRNAETLKNGNYGDGWIITADDCCESCRKNHEKKYKTRPRLIPPYHIGCNCRVEVNFE